MDKASKAATTLLETWPRNQKHLQLMINRALTGSLRRPGWRMLLSRKDARAVYDDQIAKQPSSTISPKDLEILQKSQRLLVSDFGSVAASSRLVVTVMKTVISYCHVLSKNDQFISEDSSLLHLLVPLLTVFQEECSRGDAASLIEHYISLLLMIRPALFPEFSQQVTVHDADPQFT